MPSPMKPTFIFRSLRECLYPSDPGLSRGTLPPRASWKGLGEGVARASTLRTVPPHPNPLPQGGEGTKLRLSAFSALGEPAEAFLGLAFRLVLAADPAVVADPVEVAEQERVVDFARTRLVSARIVGKLDMGDPRQVLLDRAGEIAFHDLHVIDVVLDEDFVRAGLVDQFHR